MNSTFRNLFIFVVGAGVGSMVTWKLVKTKYEEIANEEIRSVKERFKNREMGIKDVDDAGNEEDVNEDASPDNNEMEDYNRILNENGYRNYATKSEKKEDEEEMSEPYVISPDEFDENDYETETLTYYADGVLTDEYDNIIEDVEGTVGSESLNHFGEYEDDSVFVRNDERETDYEILLDARKYSEIYR